MNADALSELARSFALELGFDSAGVADARLPAIEGERLRRWLDHNYHGTMGWLDRPGRDRTDAETVLEGARAVLMVTLDYPPAPAPPEPDTGLAYVSTYARGPDYHKLLKDRLRELGARLEAAVPGLRTRPFVDTAPIVERAFARAAGLGWYGKNACLIEPGRGSWFFLGGLALDHELVPDAPVRDFCGTCTACIDACPTDALLAPHVLDSRRCLSYLTIETREAWPEDLRAAAGPHVFGCDICQAVCPWNRFARPAESTAFATDDPRLQPQPLARLFDAAMASYKGLTRGTAADRAGKKGLLRNIVTAMGNHGDAAHRGRVESLQDHPDPALADHVRWALERL